jgi:hypothetical protein
MVQKGFETLEKLCYVFAVVGYTWHHIEPDPSTLFEVQWIHVHACRMEDLPHGED